MNEYSFRFCMSGAEEGPAPAFCPRGRGFSAQLFLNPTVARARKICYHAGRTNDRNRRTRGSAGAAGMEDTMAGPIKYYIVAADALPEIFVKVAEAKRMMQTGEADTVGAATRLAGISRSAFYKYKDSVQPFNDMKAEHIITFYAMLKDVAGVLSGVLSRFAASGANILTINQSIPTNGCAAVTISAETSRMEESLEQLMGDVAALEGVLKFEILAG